MFRATGCFSRQNFVNAEQDFKQVAELKFTSRPVDIVALAFSVGRGNLKRTRFPRAFLDKSKRYVADMWSYFHCGVKERERESILISSLEISQAQVKLSLLSISMSPQVFLPDMQP